MTENPGAIPADAGAGAPATDAGAGTFAADAGAGTPAADAPVIDVPSANTPQDAIPQVTATNVTVSYETADAAANAAGDGGDATAAPTPKRSFTWLWRVLVALVIAGLIALSVYMINVTNGWRDYSAQVEAALNDVKATAASSAADLSSTQARLDTVQTQLDTANARITELANEEANATDNQDALRNHMEAMIECAAARQELIDVLTNSNLYFPGKTNAQVERELTEFCEAVKSDYQQYLAGN